MPWANAGTVLETSRLLLALCPPRCPALPMESPHCPCHSGMASGPPSRSPPPQLLAEAHAAQEAYFSLLVFFLFLISLSLKEKSMKNFW